MTMGPICIAPELKSKGYGKILLDYSLEKADLNRQASLASAIMDCRKSRMHLSFCAKN